MGACWESSADVRTAKEQTCSSLHRWLPMLVEGPPAPVGDTRAPIASSQVAEDHVARDLDVAQICCT